MTPHHEEIVERLMRLDVGAGARLRPQYAHGDSGRWYAHLGGFHLGWVGGGTGGWFANGLTPEEALDAAWARILIESQNEGVFYVRYHCDADEFPTPMTLRTCVRWDVMKDDWIDVDPATGKSAPLDVSHLWNEARYRCAWSRGQ